MPQGHLIAFVSVQAKPGWEVETTTRTLDTRVEAEGGTVTEAVDTITWTATGDTQIHRGEFDWFWVPGRSDAEYRRLVFVSTVQTYSNGEEVAWIDPMSGSTRSAPTEPNRSVPRRRLNSSRGTHGSRASAPDLLLDRTVVRPTAWVPTRPRATGDRRGNRPAVVPPADLPAHLSHCVPRRCFATERHADRAWRETRRRGWLRSPSRTSRTPQWELQRRARQSHLDPPHCGHAAAYANQSLRKT
jgi:hypothetical protein